MTIKAASLFSGIGAPEVSMPGWQWIWHAEIEDFPSAVMAARFPGSVNLGDVNAEDFVERAIGIGRPDVLVFGSPCQDFSVAGKRVGLDGARGNMAIIGLRVARELGVRWMVFENVPGLLSSYSGGAEAERAVREGPVGGRADCDEDSDFAAFLSAVRECGYLGCYRVHDAQFAGVPQRRRRIFACFSIGDWRGPAAILLEPESLRGDPPPSREAGQRITGTVEARADAGGAGWGTDFLAGGGMTCGEEIARAVKAGDKGHRHDPSTDNYVVGAMSSAGGTERKHGHGWGQQDYENGYITAVAPTLASANKPGRRPYGTDVDTATSLIVAGTLGARSADHPNGLKSEADFLVFGGNNTSGPIDAARGFERAAWGDRRRGVASGTVVRPFGRDVCFSLSARASRNACSFGPIFCIFIPAVCGEP